jgi:2'-5' RNA ligase
MQSMLATQAGSPNERYALVYILPHEAQLRIEDTFLHWQGITRPPMGYHVTALGPFVVVEGRSQDDLAIFASLCLNQMAFTLVLSEPGVFQNAANQVAYLALHNPKPMRALHEVLLEGTRDIVAAPSPEYHLWTVEQYIPHVTLGIGLGEDAVAEFLVSARCYPLKLRCQVQELSLLKQLEGGVWQQLARYPLKENRK